MKKEDLIAALVTRQRDKELCQKVVNQTFIELSRLLDVGQGIRIEKIGLFDAHFKKVKLNTKGEKIEALASESVSIFFHPSKILKQRIQEYRQDESVD